jgi:hypothetical protein
VVVGLLILLLAVGVAFIIVYLLSPSERSLHEGSVEPTIPTFYEMSGRMNAPKVQPLGQVEDGGSAGGIKRGSDRHQLRVGG